MRGTTVQIQFTLTDAIQLPVLHISNLCFAYPIQVGECSGENGESRAARLAASAIRVSLRRELHVHSLHSNRYSEEQHQQQLFKSRVIPAERFVSVLGECRREQGLKSMIIYVWYNILDNRYSSQNFQGQYLKKEQNIFLVKVSVYPFMFGEFYPMACLLPLCMLHICYLAMIERRNEIFCKI